VAGHNDLHVHFCGAGEGSLKVVELKPQEHTVAVGLVVRIPDWSMIVLDLKVVQLQDQYAAGRDQSLIFRPTVRALALIPSTISVSIAIAAFQQGRRKNKMQSLW